MSERTEGPLGAARVVEEVAVVAGAGHDEVELLTKHYMYPFLSKIFFSIIWNWEIRT